MIVGGSIIIPIDIVNVATIMFDVVVDPADAAIGSDVEGDAPRVEATHRENPVALCDSLCWITQQHEACTE